MGSICRGGMMNSLFHTLIIYGYMGSTGKGRVRVRRVVGWGPDASELLLVG